MPAILPYIHKVSGYILAIGVMVLLTACERGPTQTIKTLTTENATQVQIALLTPAGSENEKDVILAESLDNAARLALEDLGQAPIILRSYATNGTPQSARLATAQAIDEGADIILGPVYSQEAKAAGEIASERGVIVLSFSNNPQIANENVFIMGNTFQNTANRLMQYAFDQGIFRIMSVYDENTAGYLGRDAIAKGAVRAGSSVVADGSYIFSQQGVINAAPQIAQTAKDSLAQALFLTADTAGALPLVTQLLSENGAGSDVFQYIGLTRWDIPETTLSLEAVQNGWFALPNPVIYQQYEERYQAVYARRPHPISGLAYDGVAVVGALMQQNRSSTIDVNTITQPAGFSGVMGIFRFLPNGQNERGLAIGQVFNSKVIIIDPAPQSFERAPSFF